MREVRVVDSARMVHLAMTRMSLGVSGGRSRSNSSETIGVMSQRRSVVLPPQRRRESNWRRPQSRSENDVGLVVEEELQRMDVDDGEDRGIATALMSNRPSGAQRTSCSEVSKNMSSALAASTTTCWADRNRASVWPQCSQGWQDGATWRLKDYPTNWWMYVLSYVHTSSRASADLCSLLGDFLRVWRMQGKLPRFQL